MACFARPAYAFTKCPVQPVLDTRVLNAIDDVAKKIDGVVQDIVGTVSEKLEPTNSNDWRLKSRD
ncbi:hypothetical protein WQE_15446 [Paraburkholderia hospita]|uniref:Uncharacterized protein n=1 Tax=Paraburkholderia hospita TaxID=169430 RepID=A0ABN0FNQ4_9BURK|nr:hypothetical protein WQE_15446 [Paraburkholderia hospita]